MDTEYSDRTAPLLTGPNGARSSSRRIVKGSLFSIAVLLGFFEGVDLASMGLAMSRLSRDLKLDPIQAGLCASASLAGLFIGAVLAGRLADVYGRRFLLISTAFCLGIFSTLTAHAPGYHSLLVLRFMAGVGMGGLYPLVIMSVHESAGPSFRSTAVSILVAMASVGGLAVSMVAMAPDWRWIFYFGGIGPLLTIPLVFFLDIRSEQNIEQGRTADGAVTILFGQDRLIGTLGAWAACFFTSLTIYCVVNWVAALLVRQGYTDNQSHIGAATYAVGAIIGNIVAGYCTDRGAARPVYLAAYLLTACAFAVMATGPGPALTFVSIFVIAASISGGQLVTYSQLPSFYPKSGRGMGVGAMVASGRIGSICGPLLAGIVLGNGGSAEQVFLALIPGVLVALVFSLVFLSQLNVHVTTSRNG
jgi:MFS transporter, AAHS family, 3-hydroxyphenylpropionic acid transporter